MVADAYTTSTDTRSSSSRTALKTKRRVCGQANETWVDGILMAQGWMGYRRDGSTYGAGMVTDTRVMVTDGIEMPKAMAEKLRFSLHQSVRITCTPCCCPWASVCPSWSGVPLNVVPGVKMVVNAPPGIACTENDDGAFEPCCTDEGGMYVVIGNEWPPDRAVMPCTELPLPPITPMPWFDSICCVVKIAPRSCKKKLASTHKLAQFTENKNGMVEFQIMQIIALLGSRRPFERSWKRSFYTAQCCDFLRTKGEVKTTKTLRRTKKTRTDEERNGRYASRWLCEEHARNACTKNGEEWATKLGQLRHIWGEVKRDTEFESCKAIQQNQIVYQAVWTSASSQMCFLNRGSMLIIDQNAFRQR